MERSAQWTICVSASNGARDVWIRAPFRYVENRERPARRGGQRQRSADRCATPTGRLRTRVTVASKDFYLKRNAYVTPCCSRNALYTCIVILEIIPLQNRNRREVLAIARRASARCMQTEQGQGAENSRICHVAVMWNTFDSFMAPRCVIRFEPCIPPCLTVVARHGQ